MRAYEAGAEEKNTGWADSYREPLLNTFGWVLLILLILLLLFLFMLVCSGVGAGLNFYSESYSDFIPYEISYVSTPLLAKGVREVAQPGRLGLVSRLELGIATDERNIPFFARERVVRAPGIQIVYVGEGEVRGDVYGYDVEIIRAYRVRSVDVLQHRMYTRYAGDLVVVEADIRKLVENADEEAFGRLKAALYSKVSNFYFYDILDTDMNIYEEVPEGTYRKRFVFDLLSEGAFPDRNGHIKYMSDLEFHLIEGDQPVLKFDLSAFGMPPEDLLSH